MSKLTLTISGNRDTGSLHVGLGDKFATKEEALAGILSVQVEGEAAPRKVTYAMGSPKKGWSVCCKGAGKFPVGDVTVDVTLAD